MNSYRKPVNVRLGKKDLFYAPIQQFVVYEYTAEMMCDPDLTPTEYLFPSEQESLNFINIECKGRFCNYLLFDDNNEIKQFPDDCLNLEALYYPYIEPEQKNSLYTRIRAIWNIILKKNKH